MASSPPPMDIYDQGFDRVREEAFYIPYNNKSHIGAWYSMQSRMTNHSVEVLRFPLDSALPTILFQFVTIMLTCRLLVIALKPWHQPRIVACVLGGVLIGPTFLGKLLLMDGNTPVPFARFENLVGLETLGNVGLIYYMFLVGLELDLKPVVRLGKKALSIALAGVVTAFATGCLLHLFLLPHQYRDYYKGTGELEKKINHGKYFWGTALAATSFPDVTRILADLKLLHSDLGRLALSAAVIADLCSWFLYFILLETSSSASQDESSHPWWLPVVTSTAFLGLCVFVLRPALPKLIRLTTKTDDDKKENYSELHVSFVMFGAIASAMLTDWLGSFSYVGPFVFGAIVPRGDFRKLIIEKIQPFVSGIMMPLFYMILGLRVNGPLIFSDDDTRVLETFHWYNFRSFMAILTLSFLPKIVATFVAAFFNKIKPRDALALGLIMNTKGVLAILILSAGRDLKTLDRQALSNMIFVVWAITVPVGPFLAYSYKKRRRSTAYKHRNIRSIRTDTEFRILACTHDSHSSSGMINLLEASNPTRQSPIRIFATLLVELIGHTSAMIIVNDACKNKTNEGFQHREGPMINLPSQNSISNPFESYAEQRDNVYVQSFTIVSAYATMHEDICNIVDDNCITLVILPFHKESTIDGDMEESNPAIRKINKGVLENAMCSIAIFVDRGLGASQIFTSSIASPRRSSGSDSVIYNRIAVLFIGGEDDREALAYANRMAAHPKVYLTVIRFILSINPLDDAGNSNNILETIASTGDEKLTDDLYMDGFRIHTIHDSTVELLEEVVKSWEETLDIIKGMEGEYDLYIMGRRHGSTNKSTNTSTSVLDSSDADELGTLAEALVTSNFFTVDTSLLVVQQGTTEEEDQDQ